MKITRYPDRVVIDGEGAALPEPFEIVTVPEDDHNPIHLAITNFSSVRAPSGADTSTKP